VSKKKKIWNLRCAALKKALKKSNYKGIRKTSKRDLLGEEKFTEIERVGIFARPKT